MALHCEDQGAAGFFACAPAARKSLRPFPGERCFQKKGFFAKSFNLFKKIVKSRVVSQNISSALLPHLPPAPSSSQMTRLHDMSGHCSCDVQVMFAQGTAMFFADILSLFVLWFC